MYNFTVMVKDNNIEKAIRKMKNKMSKLGIVKDVKKNMYYEKPSEKRVRVLKANIINSRKAKKKREARL